MVKNLEKKFKLYCTSENFEVNQNQIKVINKLQEFFKKNLTFNFFDFFFKKKN